MNQQQDPYSTLPAQLRQELKEGAEQLSVVYGQAETALTRYTVSNNLNVSDLSVAASAACDGMKQLSNERHPLWIALKEYPFILDPPDSALREVLDDLESFVTTETAILTAAKMKKSAAEGLAREVAGAFSRFNPKVRVSPEAMRAQVDDLINASQKLNLGVCEAAARLKAEEGWDMPDRKAGLKALANRVRKSKWFIGGGTVAIADLPAVVPVFGWAAVAVTSPAAAVWYLITL